MYVITYHISRKISYVKVCNSVIKISVKKFNAGLNSMSKSMLPNPPTTSWYE